jgi:hypothetical protein
MGPPNVQHLSNSDRVTEENSKPFDVVNSTFENEKSGNGNNLDSLKSFDDMDKVIHLIATSNKPQATNSSSSDPRFDFPLSFFLWTNTPSSYMFTSFTTIYWI